MKRKWRREALRRREEQRESRFSVVKRSPVAVGSEERGT